MKSQKLEIPYLEIIKKVLNEGSEHDDRTGTGTYRVFGANASYDLSQGNLPVVTARKMAPRLAIEELIWMKSGSTNNKLLQDKNVHIWDGNSSKEECAKFGREENDLGPIYGHQMRNYNASKREVPLKEDYWSETNKRWVNRAYNDDGFDQIKNMFDLIKKSPGSRRIIVNSFHPVEATQVNPPPCHSLFMVEVIEGKINLLLLQRSGDLFLGVGMNILYYSILTCLIAKLTGYEAGQFVHQIVDAHIYKDHLDQCKELISREPYDSPQIKINDRLSGKGLDGLLDLKVSDIEILNYKFHPPLKGKMSV